MSQRRRRYFNRDQLNPLIPKAVRKQKTPKGKRTYSRKKIQSGLNQLKHLNLRRSPSVVVGHGMPYQVVRKPRNGQFFVDQDTGDTYLFASKIGWLDLNGWQPDVGEGVPDAENPPDPLSGDQYLNILNGDLYVFTDGFGWVLQNGIEGPRGPPGESFTYDLITLDGPEGPPITGPITVTPNRTVCLWIKKNKLYADLV